MNPRVEPLPEGTVLDERYTVVRPLGSGGFGITYLAQDQERHDLCVIKELAPPGVTRSDSGALDLNHFGPAQAQRLRHQFFQEAKALRRVSIRGILPMRDLFQENQTAYLVVDYLDGAIDLGRVLQSEGPMDAQGVLDILFALLETLEKLHGQGILHRDIKPSNILLTPKGDVILIDFGSAREWHATTQITHTIHFTPGYAPLEQMSERGRRGPATDLYGLCATAYALLTGFPPPASSERASGVPLLSLVELRPDLEKTVADAIEKGLALRYEDRPQDASTLRSLLSESAVDDEPANAVDLLDQKLVLLQSLRAHKRQCPSCDGLLEEPKPLKEGLCPVCRGGTIQVRKLHEHQCAACKVGILRPVANSSPLAFCPICRTGRLQAKGLLSKKKWVCAACSESFEVQGLEVIRTANGDAATWYEWRLASRRSDVVLCCDTCPAQVDEMEDGRWRYVTPDLKPYRVLYPQEWAMVAAGLNPSDGNAECPSCGADYFSHDGSLTLLKAFDDPYGFSKENQGLALTTEAARWMGAGKSSGNPGPRCGDCGTEFDWSGTQMVLITTQHPLLRHRIGEFYLLDDWHRAAHGLPWVGEEAELDKELEQALRESFRRGDHPFSPKDPDLIWKSEAHKVELEEEEWVVSGSGPLKITLETVLYGRGFRKLSLPLRMLSRVEVYEEVITLAFRDGNEVDFLIEPMSWSTKLESGAFELKLTTADLAARLESLLAEKAL